MQSFYAIFVEFPNDFVDRNVEKGEKGENCLSNGVSAEINAVFK